MTDSTSDSRSDRGRGRARQLFRVAAAVGIGAVLLRVAFPRLRLRVKTAFHERCRQMVHEMEFSERPSCEMCYEMHSAMHRRMERATAASQD